MKNIVIEFPLDPELSYSDDAIYQIALRETGKTAREIRAWEVLTNKEDMARVILFF